VMDAAVLHEYDTPRYDQFEDPAPAAGQCLVEVEASAVNPVDLLIATGSFYIKPPSLPCVVGIDGVGRLDDGRRVYFASTVAPFGGAAAWTLAPREALIDVPDGLDAPVAAALGNSGLAAWLSLQWRAALQPGEHVLVLGATGAVGRIAVQAARLLGAGRVVAVGRNAAGLERAVELGADAVIQIRPDAPLRASELRTAGEGHLDVIVDLLWGEPAAAALDAAAPGGRLVQVGHSAGQEIRLAAPLVRSRPLEIRGYGNPHASPVQRAAAYQRLGELAISGALVVDVESVPLAEVERAWERQRSGAGHKLVLLPRGHAGS
jgi:NADPH:quinone reductase-like Zn-dependent oxidoreductase